LFGYVEGCSAGLSFDSADELLAAVQVSLDCIEKGTLQALFLQGTDQLRQCIVANGEYTD
jgi:hypothetical protein